MATVTTNILAQHQLHAQVINITPVVSYSIIPPQQHKFISTQKTKQSNKQDNQQNANPKGT